MWAVYLRCARKERFDTEAGIAIFQVMVPKATADPNAIHQPGLKHQTVTHSILNQTCYVQDFMAKQTLGFIIKDIRS